MDSAALLSHLRRELAAFRACLHGDLSPPIEHCGEWTLRDLAGHMGGSNLWAATAVTDQRGGYEAPAAPRAPAALVRWFDASSETLLRALDTNPSTPAWTFHPPQTVGFWQRRRCLETLVHRWDAEHALGAVGPIDAELAAEGVAEVFDTIAPRQMARGRAQPPRCALRVQADDIGASWTYGPGAPVATVTATAANLLLLLWSRKPGNDPAIAWTGDRQAGQHILDSPLVG